MFRNPTTDLVVILLIVLLIFGPKRLPGLGKQLGQGIRDFKDSITAGTTTAMTPNGPRSRRRPRRRYRPCPRRPRQRRRRPPSVSRQRSDPSTARSGPDRTV